MTGVEAILTINFADALSLCVVFPTVLVTTTRYVPVSATDTFVNEYVANVPLRRTFTPFFYH